jgi:hypothetical protein
MWNLSCNLLGNCSIVIQKVSKRIKKLLNQWAKHWRPLSVSLSHSVPWIPPSQIHTPPLITLHCLFTMCTSDAAITGSWFLMATLRACQCLSSKLSIFSVPTLCFWITKRLHSKKKKKKWKFCQPTTSFHDMERQDPIERRRGEKPVRRHKVQNCKFKSQWVCVL